MHKLFRFYNQNRKQIWFSILIIAFIILIIRLLNQFYKENNQINNEEIENSQNTSQEKYEEESKVLVTGTQLKGKIKEAYNSLVEDFLNKCMNGEYSEAYKLLSYNCKENLYPSEEFFIEKYCSSKFSSGKSYEFNAWSMKNRKIYLVKIYENMLATGKLTNKNYIEDYYSIIEEKNSDSNEIEYKLSIGGYIDRNYINKSKEKDYIKVIVNYSDLYMENEVYHLLIQNKSEKDIMLDVRESADTVYVLDDNNYKYNALMYENLEENLIIPANDEAEIAIKFSNNYNDGISMKSLVFSKIIKDYNRYLLDKDAYEKYGDYLEIEVSL